MNSTAKSALIPLVLAATWSTAHADDFQVSVTPTVDLNHLYLFNERDTEAGPSDTVDLQAISSDVGPLLAGNTYSTTVSTSYGTSASFLGYGVNLNMAALATTSDGRLVLSGQSNGATYDTLFGTPTGVTQADALGAATSGTLSVASQLYPAYSDNRLFDAQDFSLVAIVDLLAFDADGTQHAVGTLSVQAQAVPEPASMAALGMGALALLRRRRRLG